MLSLLDTINEENNKLKKRKNNEIKQNKSLKTEKKRLQRRMDFFSYIRDRKIEIEKRKAEHKFISNCKQSFDDFLTLSHNSAGLNGIETFSTENGLSKIIFTSNLGPFSKIQLPENTNQNEVSCFLYEGFAKNENGFYEYYNISVKKSLRPDETKVTLLTGFSIEPGTKEITKINTETTADVTFIEQYFNDLEKTYESQQITRS